MTVRSGTDSTTPDAGAPRRRMTADARRAQLLDTAREVFLQAGFGGTAVRDISDAAGVNIALIYRHFASKEELFDEAVEQPLVEALDGFVEIASTASLYLGRVDMQRQFTSDLITRLLDAMCEITPLLGVVLFSSRGAAFYRDRLEPTIGTVATATETAKPHWQHRDFDASVVATMIVGTCFMYGLRSGFAGEPFDRDAVAAELCDLIFDGLLVEEG